MLKIPGILLLANAVLLYGINETYKLSEQKKQLGQAIDMLEYLKNLLYSENSVLKNAFEKICDNEIYCDFEFAGNISYLLNKGLSFEMSLKKSLYEYENAFNNEVRRSIDSLSYIIGKYDQETQNKAIESVVESLKKELRFIEEKSKEKLPIIKTLTVCGFFGVIIMFI